MRLANVAGFQIEPSEFIIETPREEDFEGISRCFLETYGHHYPHPEVWSASLYWKKVSEGLLVPLIARDWHGDVVAHIALEREKDTQIAERGEAVVLPHYRGHHLLEEMTKRLSVIAHKLGLIGIFAKPVTIHKFSQRNDEHAGMPVCALMLGIYPENLMPKGMSAPTLGQRQSVLLTFAFLKSPPLRSIYLPEPYKEIIATIYSRLNIERKIEAPMPNPSIMESTIEKRIDDQLSGFISFWCIGVDVGRVINNILREFTVVDVRSIQIFASMEDPGIQLLVSCARDNGFFFCGIGPSMLDGKDALILQSLREPVDIKKLQLFTEHAIELAKFIEEDRIRIQ